MYGTTVGVIKRDTRSLDYGSFAFSFKSMTMAIKSSMAGWTLTHLTWTAETKNGATARPVITLELCGLGTDSTR